MAMRRDQLKNRLIWLAAIFIALYSVQRQQGSLNPPRKEQEHHASANTTTTSHIDRNDVDVCFVTSVFGKSASTVDRLQNITKLDWYHNPQYHFFVYTNLPQLNEKGWTKIVKEFHFKRFITQSRWPKFLGWTDPQIQQKCQVVFYVDSIGEIIASPEDYQDQARAILHSDVGLAQFSHPQGGGAFDEFKRIKKYRKDILPNIRASKAWLSSQPDFDPNCKLYENRYIGYAINSTSFQNASTFLWEHYSQEIDSWRDQPLWCYVLSHFHIKPIPLNHKRLFRQNKKRMGKRKHIYNVHSDHDAQQARQQEVQQYNNSVS